MPSLNFVNLFVDFNPRIKQAGAELGQAQLPIGS